MTATVYGPSASGARIVSLDVAGMRVIVDPLDADNNKSAKELAERIDRYEAETGRLRRLLENAREDRERSEAKLRNERAINDAALTGRRRFFGPVVMVPADMNVGWHGPVLLFDQEMLFSGNCLRFDSSADVHREHPELWVVGTMKIDHWSDGVVLDAWGQP